MFPPWLVSNGDISPCSISFDERNFHCNLPNCSGKHDYKSKTALNRHYRTKHPELFSSDKNLSPEASDSSAEKERNNHRYQPYPSRSKKSRKPLTTSVQRRGQSSSSTTSSSYMSSANIAQPTSEMCALPTSISTSLSSPISEASGSEAPTSPTLTTRSSEMECGSGRNKLDWFADLIIQLETESSAAFPSVASARYDPVREAVALQKEQRRL